jgi:hypothetical protein
MPFLAILTKLIPPKDMVIGALVIGLLILSWHFYDKYEDAVKYASTVKAESIVALAEANKTIADNNTAHAATIAQVKKVYDLSQQIALAQHNSDANRLRQFDSYRQANPVLDSTPSSINQPGAAEWYAALVRLEPVALNLANALRQDDDLLSACRTERDSLTGK